ncbi:acid protease, partial [Viridothelium virens]
GIDGPWSTFWAQVGTPPQVVRLLPGTSADALWVPLPEGCTSQDPPDCLQSRTVFNPNESSTWHQIGIYHLGLSQESFLGYDPDTDNAKDANETFTLGLPGSGLPTVNNSIVEGIATKDFYMGLIGLNPQAINLSSIADPQPSLLQSLRDSGSIPSLSWAYTAGSVNLGSAAYGSLTLGGYDTSRFLVNNLSFPFVADSSRDLVIGVQSIKTDAPNNSSLLTEGISAFIDSLVPEFWLPLEVCTAFEQAFGLTWNETESRYLLNDSAHNALVDLNPNVTFTLGAESSGGDNVNIVFPYTSFDLTATPPLVNKSSSYFPLKRAQNSTQYTLGRAFFQNAYVITDYERSNFSVHQALVPSSTNKQNLVPILSPNPTEQPSQPSLTSQTNKSNSSGVSGGAIAGIVIGVLAVLIAAVGAILFYRRQKKRRRSE